ncbi:DUF6036 family nucleotidyltransferase [Persephonella sp.]
MTLDIENIKKILEEFIRETGEDLELILIGGLALQLYGLENRATIDIDAEIEKGNLFELYRFLKEKGIPADLTESISGWSVIAMPEGYKERAKPVLKDGKLTIKLLDPYDFVIAKLRRGTQEDLDDALFVARKFSLEPEKILEFGELAVKSSVKDTALLSFRERLKIFINELKNG